MRQYTLPRIREPDDSRLVAAYRVAISKRPEQELSDKRLNLQLIIREGVFPQGPILEVGCGTGEMSVVFAEAFRDVKVVGLDIDREAIGFARAHYSAPNLEYRVGEAYDLSEFQGKQGMVFTMGCLHHFNRIRDFFEQACRALDSGGVFYGADLNRESILRPSLEGGQIGDSLDIIETYYRLREVANDMTFVDFLEGQGKLSGEAALEILLMLSYMAAYTPPELQQALKGTRFSSCSVVSRGKYAEDMRILTKK